MAENSASAPGDALDAPTAALAAAVLEVARHVGDAPLAAPRWFALVDTGALIRSQPSFGALLDDASREAAEADPHHLTPIEIDDAPAVHDPLHALAEVVWPDIAVGGVVACDLDAVRVTEGSSEQARERLGDGAVRTVVAARTGRDAGTWCAVRGRGRRDYALGTHLVPDLADALAESLGEGESTLR